jgi:hypothetical protein
MLSRESSNYVPNSADEVSALVQVGSPQLPGYGGQAGKPLGWQDSPYQNWPGTGTGTGTGTGNGNGAAPGAFQIPNNFWGFVMLVMGMR